MTEIEELADLYLRLPPAVRQEALNFLRFFEQRADGDADVGRSPDPLAILEQVGFIGCIDAEPEPSETCKAASCWFPRAALEPDAGALRPVPGCCAPVQARYSKVGAGGRAARGDGSPTRRGGTSGMQPPIQRGSQRADALGAGLPTSAQERPAW